MNAAAREKGIVGYFIATVAVLILLGIGATLWSQYDLRFDIRSNLPKPVKINIMNSTLSTTFTCPDGTSHTVTDTQEPTERYEDFVTRHRDNVQRAKAILCGPR